MAGVFDPTEPPPVPLTTFGVGVFVAPIVAFTLPSPFVTTGVVVVPTLLLIFPNVAFGVVAAVGVGVDPEIMFVIDVYRLLKNPPMPPVLAGVGVTDGAFVGVFVTVIVVVVFGGVATATVFTTHLNPSR